ncbi:MAG: type IV pilin-like G/H family protein [Leptolyngbyaceae cyanobacterium bins.302]|nr:type IV pilin-like G/H family protein [Leptolyngbyaceae cyanobacterium bins.302]
MRTKVPTRIVSYGAVNRVSGFTLLEIMTVMVIGGILAAISMPYFLSRATAAKQAEGKMLVGTMNRAQQAYYTQNSKFSDTVDALALNLRSNNYTLVVRPGNAESTYAANHATSKHIKVRSYVGMSAIVQDTSGNLSMETVLCESLSPGSVEATKPTYTTATVDCAPGTQRLK